MVIACFIEGGLVEIYLTEKIMKIEQGKKKFESFEKKFKKKFKISLTKKVVIRFFSNKV